MGKIAGFFIILIVTIGSAKAEPSLPVDPNAVFPIESVVVKTSVGEFSFSVEIADEPHERERGLMHREEMLSTHGMLFDFGRTQPVMMWMENTPRSLDMIFIHESGKVARIERATTPFSRNIISSREPVSHVLELNAGIALQIGLEVGDQICHPMFTNK